MMVLDEVDMEHEVVKCGMCISKGDECCEMREITVEEGS